MVKTPRTRHSRTEKEPVTIDLAPDEVSRATPGDAPAAGTGPRQDKTGPGDAPAFGRDAPKDTVADKPAAEAAGPATQRPAASAAREDKAPAFGRHDAPGNAPKDAAASERAAESSRPVPPPPAAPASRGGGLLAGLVGGVAALAIAAGLQFAGLLPGATTQPAPAAPDHGPAIAALEAEIAGLKSEIAALPVPGDGGEALDARVAGIEERVSELASGLEALRAEVTDIAARPAPEGGAPAAPADLSPFEERIAALEADLGGLRETVAPASALAAVEQALASLRGELAANAEGEAASVARLDALEAAVATLTGRVEEQAEAPATAIIIAASSLKAAIDRGTPFTTELDTYAALVPDAPQLDELRALAASGVPTRAQISAESDAAANAMIAAARPVDPEAGIVDRLMGSMMGLVQVRPIGMVEGEGVPEIAARLDAAVRAGDYERALAEYETLPAEARAAGEAFISRLRARHAADRLADEALAAALRA